MTKYWRTYIDKNCETCGESFKARKDHVKTGGGKFCSRSCMGKSFWQEGHTPHNKGLKGIHYSPATEFKSKKHRFKGTDNEYKYLHYRIAKMLGKPTTCEKCKAANLTGRKIHWANISGNYIEIKEDWIRLCVKCHYYMDRASDRFSNDSL